MPVLTRRSALASAGAALASQLPLARFAIAQSDQRPSVTVAVQKIANTNTLETLREQSNVGTRHGGSYGEALIEQDWLGDLRLQPGLATEWRRVDERTLEFTLRPGVRFHDNREMTAEDVAFSFGPQRMWGADPAAARNLFGNVPGRTGSKEPPPEAAAIARRTYPGFERIEVVDARTVRFVNRVPDPALEGRLSRTTGMILSQAGFEAAGSWLDWARKPVGTGPYKVTDFRPDQSLTLVAHDEHWRGRPPLRQIRFIEVPEVSGRINALLSGEADFACDIPPDQIGALDRSARHEVVGGPIMNHRLTVFDKSHPSLRDARIRRAFTHAIDRKAITDALWGGRAPVPPGLQFAYYGPMLVEGWEAPRFDPAEARRLLREANYKGEPIPYRLLNNYYTAQVPTAQILLEGWRAVGLNVVIEMKENFPQVLSNAGAGTPAGRGVRDWSNSASFNDPVASLTAQHGPQGQQWQIGEWRNEEFGQLSAVLEGSMDQEERRRTFRRMLEIAEREDPAYTVLHQTLNFTAKRRDLPWKAGQSFFMDFSARNWGA
ncbi:ABC transporter substrate-binding protein [Roseomonas sp. SSH11]|uniref:ABC transporter substrate-binding protein n=1 Tax=Pararoseomonas baculiformis TaxID=2820812 RepID=A0ABS4AE64_9PROT|nr:ABC transporter substrate-binding protein [Pararoseomonas baculiformis]MBP0445307.1 ABC transporter substrate-binding protein [Pararoseomonas baculiformis]